MLALQEIVADICDACSPGFGPRVVAGGAVRAEFPLPGTYKTFSKAQERPA
ncbi:hypothetical protein ACT6QG_09370 [Xanthobacter sp. TB0136]|uniref:hypothetical protein n=1 Tax=Xanthobacter sp. TB0136 TaxID=3459177 RepID=UPI004039455F